METWHVTVGFTTEESLNEETPFDIAESLSAYAASMSIARDFKAGDIILTVEALSAMEGATAAAESVRDAFNGLAIEVDIVSLITQSEKAFQDELATPVFPEVVGFAEIAEMAGVTRQRAGKFRKVQGFPNPVIETAQGPLMSKAAVSRWLETRNTTPGRPSRAALTPTS